MFFRYLAALLQVEHQTKILISSLEVIKLECSHRLKIKRKRVCKQPIIVLYFES